MRLYMVLLISLLNLTAQKGTHASYHFSNDPDEVFINLAKKFPSVGHFSLPNHPSFGSGTLVDVGIPELANRVVITCAHIFDEEDSNKVVFTCGDEEPVKGKAFIHPQYAEVYKEHEWAPSSHDISVFVLERPLTSIPSAQIDESPYQDLISKFIIQVGYGMTSHFLGKYSIMDQEKRASYSYVPSHAHYNNLQDIEKTLGFKTISGEPYQVKFTFPAGSQLTVTPWKSVTFINNEQPVMEFSRAPSGVACMGDSGGGCFNEDGLFLGVISGGSVDSFKKEYVIKAEHYQRYKSFFDKNFEELKEISQENEAIKGPLIVSDINPYFTPFYEANSASSNQFLISNGKISLFSFHKQWIIETLKAYLSSTLIKP